MKHVSTFILAAAVTAACPAAAQTIEGWDTDGDGVINESEWNTGLSEMGLFSDWDADGNDALSSDEFGQGLFGRFDDDDNGSLTTNEWDSGIDSFYGEQAVDLSFDNWNSDGDDVLSQEEFVAGFNDAGIFNDFVTEAEIDNADDGIAEDEFFGGLFNWFDDDDDSGIIADETGWFG